MMCDNRAPNNRVHGSLAKLKVDFLNDCTEQNDKVKSLFFRNPTEYPNSAKDSYSLVVRSNELATQETPCDRVINFESEALLQNWFTSATSSHSEMNGHFLANPTVSVVTNCERPYLPEVDIIPSNGSGADLHHDAQPAKVPTQKTQSDLTAEISNNNNSNRKPISDEKPHACSKCGKKFRLKHHLTTHCKSHDNHRPYMCNACGKSFSMKHILNTHYALHSRDRPYPCSICQKSFTLKHHLVSHLLIHNRDCPYMCGECGRKFSQKRQLTMHMKFHTGERPFLCGICNENFTKEEHLIIHSRFHGGQNAFACDECGDSFQRKFELLNHRKTHGKTPDVCEICKKEFYQKRTFRAHKKICGESQAETNAQISTAKLSVGNTFACEDCGATFGTHEGLSLHNRLHRGDESFLNDLYNLAASVKRNAGPLPPQYTSSAVTDSSATSKTFKFVCPSCGKCFSQKHGLAQHRARNPEGECNLKLHTCVVCSRSFRQRNHLVLHERNHDRVLPCKNIEVQSDVRRKNIEFDVQRKNIEVKSDVRRKNIEIASNVGNGDVFESAPPSQNISGCSMERNVNMVLLRDNNGTLQLISNV